MQLSRTVYFSALGFLLFFGPALLVPLAYLGNTAELSGEMPGTNRLEVARQFFDGVPKPQLGVSYRAVSAVAKCVVPKPAIKISLCFIQSSLGMIGIDLLFMCFSGATYTVIVVCSVRVWLFMRRSFALIASCSDGTKAAEQKKRRSLSVQINVVLVAQALIPLCVELVPICFLAVSSLERVSSTVVASSLMTLFFNWAPVINALSVILIVKPYREAIFHVFGGICRSGRGASGNVHVMPVSSAGMTGTQASAGVRPGR